MPALRNSLSPVQVYSWMDFLVSDFPVMIFDTMGGDKSTPSYEQIIALQTEDGPQLETVENVPVNWETLPNWASGRNPAALGSVE